jgi:type II secretory pathway pseudopilin PulG
MRRRTAFSLVELLVVLGIVFVILALALPAIQRVRGTLARVECMNKLHQLGLALHHYHNDHGIFPPGLTTPKPNEKMPWVTFLTRTLPYLERTELWQQAQLAYQSNPNYWEVPPHTPLITVVKAFTCPLDERLNQPQTTHMNFVAALTSYVGCNGTQRSARDGILFPDSRIALTDIHDGTSWTILVGERPPSGDFWFGWWYGSYGQNGTGAPDSLLGVNEINAGGPFAGSSCPTGPYAFGPGKIHDVCDAFKYWSLHPGGSHFLMADKAVHFIGYHGGARVLPALATRAGGEAAMLPD